MRTSDDIVLTSLSTWKRLDTNEHQDWYKDTKNSTKVQHKTRNRRQL